MKSLIESSLQPAAVYNRKKACFIECNLKTAQLFGYDTCEEWLNLSLLDYFHAEQFDGTKPEEALKDIYRHFEINDVHFTSIVGTKKNGSKIILELFAIKNYLSYGSGTVFFFKEIDEKYLSNKITLDNNLIYQTILNSSFDFIDIIGIDILDYKTFSYNAEVLDRNQNMKNVLGVDDEPLVSIEEIEKYTPHNYLEENRNLFSEVATKLRKTGAESFEWRFNRTDGQIIHMNAGVYTHQLGSKVILVRIMRDITESVEKERLIIKQNESLKTKNQELEEYIESNVQLQNFAHIASHDIKAPLRTITSFSQILQKKIKDKLTPQESELFSHIIDGSQNLTRLVDDLLDFSKMTSQKIEVESVNPNNLIERVKRDLTSIINESGTEIVLNNLPDKINADYTKLKRVFQNIIQNAIKFTKQKTQKPCIEITSSQTEKHWCFSITDNGIGIRDEQLSEVFKMFRRLNGHNYTGSGMGMALSQKIIEQHKGKIWAKSTFGEGTTFTFTISKELKVATVLA